MQAGELSSAPQVDKEAEQPADELGVIKLTERDPPLGLAKLRMDLERETRRIYQQRLPRPARRGLSPGMMMHELARERCSTTRDRGASAGCPCLANRAVHGEYVQREAVEEIAEVGMRVLEALESLEEYPGK